MHEDASGLVRRIDAGRAPVMSAAVRFDRGRWFVSFTVKVQPPVLTSSQPDAVVGVDLGIKSLAALSTGEVIDNPRHLGSALRKVRRPSRRASRRAGPYDCATKKHRSPSKCWRQATAALGKAQGRVADQRKDAIHKLTTRLARKYGTVVIEDLFVAGMVGDHCLGRHVADASFGQIRRQLESKTTWNGGPTIVVDRWFPSSMTCPGCGPAKAKLAPSERTYLCTLCGLVLDRDVNAAEPRRVE
jgi:IS605 OrfB family transposase